MKTWGKVCVALLVSMPLTGCTITVKELRHSGGYPGDILDRRFFNASHSKQLQLLRAAMIVSMASRVATAYVQDGKDAEAFVEYLQAATDEINYLGGHVYGEAGKKHCKDFKETDCDNHSVMFEADLPQLEARIVRLAVAALPRRQAAKLLNSARSGNVLSAAWSALGLAAAAAEGAHRGAAVHRSTLEMRALLIQLDDTEKIECAPASSVSTPVATVNEAAACVNQSVQKLRAPNDTPLPRAVPKEAFYALFGIIRTSCGLLPVASDLSDAETNTVLRDRKKACGELKFEPKSRFGGLKGFEKEETKDEQGNDGS